jgi:hypothetical protein
MSACLLPTADSDRIETIGLYASAPSPRYYAFYKASGYNVLQFVDEGLSQPPGQRDAYYADLAEGIKLAKKQGFRVWVVLLSDVPDYPEFGKSWAFDPTDRQAMQKRLDGISRAVKALRDADGFTFFAADPGGSPRRLGIDGIRIFLDMTRRVREIVEADAPKAQFNVNIWAVTAWEDMSISPFKSPFWVKEVSWGRFLMAEPGLFGRGCGVEFGPHNY